MVKNVRTRLCLTKLELVVGIGRHQCGNQATQAGQEWGGGGDEQLSQASRRPNTFYTYT